jgi:hypothetical protein
LYFDRLSRNGKKIPYLSHKQILKYVREIGKGNQISLVSIQPGITHPLLIHFESNGNLSIECSFGKPASESEIDAQMIAWLNPFFREWNRTFRPTGYQLPEFVSLRHPSVEMISLKYVVKAPIEHDVRLEKVSCIYSLFTVSHPRNSPEPVVRYKRVENFREMDAEMALVAELTHSSKYTDITALDIIEQLKEKFGRTEDEARKRLVDYLNQQHDFSGKQDEHPGFPARIDIVKLENILLFEIDRVDSIRYVEPIRKYIESILQMTQTIKPRSSLGKYVREVCSLSRKKMEDIPLAPENRVIDPPRKGRIQPVRFSTIEDDAFFRDLGIEETPELDDEIHEEDTVSAKWLERDLDKVDEWSEPEVDGLFQELYRNTGKTEPSGQPLGQPPAQPPAPSGAHQCPSSVSQWLTHRHSPLLHY